MSNHDIEGVRMVRSHSHIVCTYVIMSLPRRPDDHDYKRTERAPRSDPTTFTRRTSLRHLSRLEPRHFLVRQMVGRISAQPRDRFCRPLTCSAPFSPADAYQCRASGARSPADTRTSHDAPDALRIDWRTRDLGSPQGAATLALAQRTDYSAHPGPAPSHPPARREHQCGLLSLATRLGRECDPRHRYHYQACARRSRNPELSYHRSRLARRLLDAAPEQDQSHKLRPFAAKLGDTR